MAKSVSALSNADAAPSSERASDRSVDVAVEHHDLREPANFEAIFPIGSVVDNKYRIDAVLGRGGMGLVVAATHTELNEPFAIKFLYVRGGETEEYKSRFRREAQVSARLRSEHVARVIDVGVSHGTMFMVMEHLTGDDLRSTLKASSPMPLPQVIDLVVQMCQGVVEAHAHNIVHRDLKPSNVFITQRSDGTNLVKILDFGVSKWSAMTEGISDLTETGALLGSPKYMSPEQLFGASSVDARADLWSVACIVYEMFAGRPPYDEPSLTLLCAALAQNRQPPSLAALRPDLPPGVDAAILRGLVMDREKRTQNLAVFAGELLAAVGSPAAADVQARLAATLGRAGARPQTSTTSGAHAALARTGSSANAYMPATEWAASQSGSLPGAKPAKSTSTVIALALVALLVTSSAAYVIGTNSRARDGAKLDIAAVASAASTPSQMAPTQLASPASLAAPGAPTSAPVPAPTNPVASAVLAPPSSAPSAPAPVVTHRAAESRPAPRPARAAPPEPAAALAPIAPPTTAATATAATAADTTPAPPKKARMPLQDRQ